MSLKPPKKSDLGKRWMKPRVSKNIPIQPEYHLIVTEGTKTEPNYFEAIKKRIEQKFPNKIKLEVQGAGDNTINLFYIARDYPRPPGNNYQHVWIVYDTDDFLADNINRTADLCRQESTEDTTYHPICSNQCIELWFLLHFCYMSSDLHRTEYFPKISNYLEALGYGPYQKNRNDIFEILLPYMQVAIRNAERLAKLHTGKPPASAAPSTQVYELIKMLEPYL